MNKPSITTIQESYLENKDTKTFLFRYPIKVKPGQFFMIWIPDVDEIPLSCSYIDDTIKGITFRIVGDATEKLFELDVGDKIGVRGPYGNGFNIENGNILFIGGGTGIITLTPAVEEARKKGIDTTVIIGAKTEEEIIFEKRLKETGSKIYITTDDGSKGFKGFASDLAYKLLSKEKFSSIITCGPELMMKKIMDIRNNIPMQASLERYMKCGIGLCGHCVIGKGLRVCIDGPVFNHQQLGEIKDFGLYRRDASGRKIFFKKVKKL